MSNVPTPSVPTSNVLPFDPTKRRTHKSTPSHHSPTAPSPEVHTSSLRRSDLPWVLVFDIGPYQIPLFVGLPGDDPPSAA